MSGDISCQPEPEIDYPGEASHEACTDSKSKANPAIVAPLFASMAATAKQIENMKPDLVAIVGDEQYQVGQYSGL